MIIGLDLSLTATGWAQYDGGFQYGTLKDKMHHGESTDDRLMRLEDIIITAVWHGLPEMLVMEGLSYGSNDASAQERAALHFFIRRHFRNCKIPIIVCAPSTLKKFVTGKGNSEKNIMIREVFRRWGIEAANDNEADAVALAAVGACLVGQMEPTTTQQREVIALLRKQL
jgi:crossover junction endodeoxyribonuclease RuvC